MPGIDGPAAIVGVGQRFAGDDGVGREVVRRLLCDGIPAKGVDDGAGLLNVLLAGASRVLVIDAVVGGGIAGTVHVLGRANLEEGPRPVSSHGITVLDAIKLAALARPGLEVTLLGIAIDPPCAFGEGLSPEVAASVDEATKRVTQLIGTTSPHSPALRRTEHSTIWASRQHDRMHARSRIQKDHDMNDKELYQQKMQARLNEWKADVDKLKAKASGASADVQLDMNRQIKVLEHNIEEGKAKLSELATAGEDAWESIREGVESAWGSLKSGVTDAAAKLKK